LALATITAVAFAEVEYISPTGVSQRLIAKHLYEAQQNSLNKLHATAGIAMNAANKRCITIDATTGISNGIFCVIAQETGAATLLAKSTIQAADTTCYYVYAYDPTSTGETQVFKGVDNDLDVENITIDENHIPMAYVKVVTVAATFTMGTDNYDKSGVTSTFYNIGAMPYRVKVLNTSR
jgi:hypothetical protein